MKQVLHLAAAAVLALAPAIASAQQGHTITYGRATVNFSQNFQQTLSSLGASLTDLNAVPLANGIGIFEATEGVVDLQTGVAELTTRGGYAVSAGGTFVKVQNLVVDLSNPLTPVVTGIFVINGTVIPRQPIFQLAVPPGTAIPLTPQNGVEILNGFPATLAPAAAATINSIFGGPVLQPNTPIGTVDFYAVLAATNGLL